MTVKLSLKCWNKEIFGDVHNNVKLEMEKVQSIQNSKFAANSVLDIEAKALLATLDNALIAQKVVW